MRRFSWNGLFLIAGLAIFAITLAMPWWRWAIRCQVDVPLGRVKFEKPGSPREREEHEGPVWAKLPYWNSLKRDYGNDPLFAKPRSVDEKVANALWMPNGWACRKALREVAQANPNSALAQAMVATDVGSTRPATIASARAEDFMYRHHPPAVRLAAARRGAKLEPDNAFWPLATTWPRDVRLSLSELREAYVAAGSSGRYEDPRQGFRAFFSRAVADRLRRGHLAAAWSGATAYWPGSVCLDVKNFGDDKQSLAARAAVLKAADLRARSGDALDIVFASLEADAAVLGPKSKTVGTPGSRIEAARAFEAKARAVGVGLQRFDVVRSIREHERRQQAPRELLDRKPVEGRLVDYAMLGVTALLVALVAFPCSLFVSAIQKLKTNERFRRFAPPVAGALVGGFVAIQIDAFVWVPAALFLIAECTLHLERKLFATVAGAAAVVASLAFGTMTPATLLPAAAFLAVGLGSVIPERKFLALSTGTLATILMALPVGMWLALWRVGYAVSPVGLVGVLFVMAAALPRGKTSAVQLCAVWILVLALVHAGFTAAQIQQDGYCARRIQRDLRNSGDEVRRTAAKMPLPE